MVKGKMITSRILILIVSLSLLLFLPTLALAQEETISTSISPVVFELTANPGESQTNTVKVTNTGSSASDYQITIESFSGNDRGQAIVNGDTDPEYELKKWVSIKPDKFHLAKEANQIVTFTINVPSDAAPGGRYGTILASPSGQGQVNGTGAVVRQKVGTLVLLSVKGDVSYSANVQEFKTTKTLFERAPVDFSTKIYNGSTVHVKPRGFITVANTFGHKVAEVEFKQGNILPKSDRIYDGQISQKLPIGRYVATLALNYGEKGDQLISTTSFIVFPWKVGLPIIAGLLILFWLIIAKRRNIGAALRVLFRGGS